MELNQTLQTYAAQPLSYHLITSLLTAYKRPNDKINDLVKQGTLIPLKKGLYMTGKTKIKPEPFLIANHLWGPSYVSLDTALSWHGIIPERVYSVSSVTIKESRIFTNAAGRFEYVHATPPFYAYGISQVKLAEDQMAMIASPEKALCDKIIHSSGVNFRSAKNVLDYLIENLRIDESFLRSVDANKIRSWIPKAQKKTSLLMMVNTLEKL